MWLRSLVMVLAVALLVQSCAWFQKQSCSTKTGAGVGAVVGGLAGLIIDSHNPWRGGLIGAAAGAVVGGVIGNIVDYSSREAAHKNAPVKYARATENGTNEEVAATPRETKGSYKLVSVKYVRDGNVVGEEVKKVPLN